MLKKSLLRYLLLLFVGTTLFHTPTNCSFFSNKNNQKLIGIFFAGILISIGIVYLFEKYRSKNNTLNQIPSSKTEIQKLKQETKILQQNLEAEKIKNESGKPDSDNTELNKLLILYYNLGSLTDFLEKNAVNAEKIREKLNNIKIKDINFLEKELEEISKNVDEQLESLGYKYTGENFEIISPVKTLTGKTYKILFNNSLYNKTKKYKKMVLNLLIHLITSM